MPSEAKAVTNFWDLDERVHDAVYRVMIGDAYSHADILHAQELQDFEADIEAPDMSDYTYHPVLHSRDITRIERQYGVRLRHAGVRKITGKLYELQVGGQTNDN